MKFLFDITDKVRITQLNVDGVVKSIWITERGVQYEVRYFDEGSAKQVYFYPDELKKV